MRTSAGLGDGEATGANAKLGAAAGVEGAESDPPETLPEKRAAAPGFSKPSSKSAMGSSGYCQVTLGHNSKAVSNKGLRKTVASMLIYLYRVTTVGSLLSYLKKPMRRFLMSAAVTPCKREPTTTYLAVTTCMSGSS